MACTPQYINDEEWGLQEAFHSPVHEMKAWSRVKAHRRDRGTWGQVVPHPLCRQGQPDPSL